MPNYPAPLSSPGLAEAFVAVAAFVIVVAALLVRRSRLALGHGRERANASSALTAVALSAWASACVALAASGVLSDFSRRPPPGLVMMLVIGLLAVTIARSRLGGFLADGLTTTALIGFQAFRLPLELVMHRAATEGVMPEQMTYTGMNLDIVTGIAAIVVLVLFRRGEPPRAVATAFAVLGTSLVVAIVAIAVMSTPAVRAFGDDPSAVNSFVFYPPYVLLPAVMVLVAVVGQLVLIRRLVRSGANESSRGC